MSNMYSFRRKKYRATGPVQVYCRTCKRRAMANAAVVGKERSFDNCDECREPKK